jgi:hypothetical protein
MIVIETVSAASAVVAIVRGASRARISGSEVSRKPKK